MQRESCDVGLRHRRPLFLVPAAAHDPLTRPCFGGRLAHHADDLLPARGAHQLQAELRLSDAGEVCVAFHKARHGHLAIEINDLRVWSHVAPDLGVGAQRHDRVAVDRHRLRRRPRIVGGDNAAVADDEGGRCGLGLLRLRGDLRDGRHGNEQTGGNQSLGAESGSHASRKDTPSGFRVLGSRFWVLGQGSGSGTRGAFPRGGNTAPPETPDRPQSRTQDDNRTGG